MGALRIGILALIVGLVMVPALVADTVTFVGGNGFGPYYSAASDSGEFTLHVDSSGLMWILGTGYIPPAAGTGGTMDVIDTDAGKTQLTNTFQSFCVEQIETVAKYGTYTPTFSMGSIETGKPLTDGAAYLYYHFAIGDLAGYDYTDPGRSGIGSSSDLLHKALYWFMGVGPDPGITNSFEVLGNANGGLTAGNDGLPVEVMNLWVPGYVDKPNGARQDVLVLTPVPDGGLTVMLLGIGVGILAVIARRLGR
ncbi:MAG: hypothetical protein ABSC02_12410 [Acidobacteriota bacterium]|jgi:hypothetical protein